MIRRPILVCVSAIVCLLPEFVSTQPGPAGRNYTYTVIADLMPCHSFGSPAINNSGEVAFIGNCPAPVNEARVVRKGDGVTLTDIHVADTTALYAISESIVSINDLGVVAFAGVRKSSGAGLILAGDGGPLSLVADTSIHNQWSAVARPSINNANAVAFMAVAAGAASYNTVVRANPNGSFTTIGKPGDAAPGAGTILQAFEPALNNVGQVEFFVNTVQGVPGIYRGTGGALTRITAGGSINTLNGINDSGRVAFMITSAGVKTGAGGALTTIVAWSPSLVPSSSIAAINNANVVAFQATTGTGATGIFVGDGVATEAVALSGDLIPGLGTVMGAFTTEEGINDAGQVAFTLLYNDGGSIKRAIVRADPILPEIATLKLPATATGCKNVSASVTLDRPAPPGGVLVELESSNPAASVPPSVRIASGKISGKFRVSVTPVLANQVGAITATLDSSAESRPLTVVPISVQSLTLAPNSVVGGNPVTATVTLECAAPYDISVALSSTKPAVAQPAVPFLLVHAGTRTAAFAVNTTNVAAASNATIRATANGRTKSKKLVVSP